MFSGIGNRLSGPVKTVRVVAAAAVSVMAVAGPLAAWDRGTVAYDSGCRAVVEPVFPPDSTHLLPAGRES